MYARAGSRGVMFLAVATAIYVVYVGRQVV